MGSFARPLDGKHILLVEDEFLVGADLRDALIEAGSYVVGPIPSVGGSAALLDQLGFDGALVDLKLVDGSGLAVAEKLQRHGVPYIFVTGFDRDGLPAAARSKPVIHKPMRREHVIEMASRHFIEVA